MMTRRSAVRWVVSAERRLPRHFLCQRVSQGSRASRTRQRQRQQPRRSSASGHWRWTLLKASKPHVTRDTLLLTGALLLTLTAAHAQTPPPTAPKPGPGKPLPRIDVKYDTLTSEQDTQGLTRITATGSVILTYGDLRIQADT